MDYRRNVAHRRRTSLEVNRNDSLNEWFNQYELNPEELTNENEIINGRARCQRGVDRAGLRWWSPWQWRWKLRCERPWGLTKQQRSILSLSADAQFQRQRTNNVFRPTLLVGRREIIPVHEFSAALY